MDLQLRALADGTRREILALAWTAERSATDIAAHFPISRPAVSQHLRVLREAGLLTVRPEGTHRFYRTDLAKVGGLRRMLEEFWDQRLAQLKAVVEAEARRGPKS